MRNVAILEASAAGNVDRIVIDGLPVTCGIVETSPPAFDPEAPADRRRVLVRKRAFSCNYRDKTLISLMAARPPGPRSVGGFYVVGSEFAAEVMAIGASVTSLRVGDRVMGDGAWPDSGVDGVAPGVPTNHASREQEIFHEAKLVRVPSSMPDPVAAAFSIGAQTSYSMIRRGRIRPGARVLVLSAGSNTSLFLLSALRGRGAIVHAVSTSHRVADRVARFGAEELHIATADDRSLLEVDSLRRVVERTGEFDCILDPFYDLHIGRAIGMVAPGGAYVYCGLQEQFSAVGRPRRGVRGGADDVFFEALVRGADIVANCLGSHSDLHRAIRDFEDGTFEVPLDACVSDAGAGAFLDRTFSAPDRHGKVVYCYT